MRWRGVVLAGGTAPFVYLLIVELLLRASGDTTPNGSLGHLLGPAAALFALSLAVYVATAGRARAERRHQQEIADRRRESREVAITEFAVHLDRRRFADFRPTPSARRRTLRNLRDQLSALPSARTHAVPEASLKRPDRSG